MLQNSPLIRMKNIFCQNEVVVLNAIQAEVPSTQTLNWAIIQEQFDTFEQNFHFFCDCKRVLVRMGK